MATWSEIYRRGLLEDTLPFWLRHSVDHEFGGYMTCLDQDGTVVDTDKGMWQQGRFVWLLSHLYNTVEQNEDWRRAAETGIRFIRQHGFDTDGRAWFHVTRQGLPLRKRRYLFTECFLVMALAEYSKAANCAATRDDAITLFNNYERWKNDITVLPPKYTATRPTKSIGVPMIEMGMCQVMRDAFDSTDYDAQIDACIEEIQRDFVKSDHHVVMETVGPMGEIIDHFDGRTLNPGHAIEAAWFIMSEGQRRNRNDYLQLGCSMLDWMWDRGWDPDFGGLFYFRDLDGRPVQEYWHDMKFWWPHCETIIATMLAHHLTGNDKYGQWHQKIHDWSYLHFPDDAYGEWFGYLHRDGTQSVSLKGNLWKGPFHLPRMQKICGTIAVEQDVQGEA